MGLQTSVRNKRRRDTPISENECFATNYPKGHSLTLPHNRHKLRHSYLSLVLFLLAIPYLASVRPGLRPSTLRQMTDDAGVRSHRPRFNPERCHGTHATTRPARARPDISRQRQARRKWCCCRRWRDQYHDMRLSPHAPLQLPSTPPVYFLMGQQSPVRTQSIC